MDKNEAIEKIKEGDLWFLNYNSELSNDYEFMLQAVTITSYAMQYASNELKNNEEFMVDAFSKDAGILRFAGKIKNSEQFQKRISEINNTKIEDVKKEIGTEKFDTIQKLRTRYLPSDSILVPAPLTEGEVEYSYYDSVPDWHYMSGKRQEFCCLEHVIVEKYKEGCLTEVELYDHSLENDSKSLFFKSEGILDREVIYDRYYSESDYTENLYREDGTLRVSKSHQDNEYDYSDSTIDYADDGKTILREFSYNRDSDGCDHYTQCVNDINGEIMYYADYSENEDYSDNSKHRTRIERSYFDLKSHKPISKAEFFKQLNEKYSDENSIIPELGITKKGLIDFLNQDIGITKYEEDGIIVDNDMDNYYVVNIYHNPDGTIVKVCDWQDGKNYSVSNYNSNRKLVTQSVTRDGETSKVIDNRSSQEPTEPLTYKLGELHEFDEVAKAVSDRKLEDISGVISEISKEMENKSKDNESTIDSQK